MRSPHSARSIAADLLTKQPSWCVFTVAFVTFALYAVVAGYPFLAHDDNFFVTENAHVKQGLTRESFFWSWTATLGFYHPLTWLSLMLDSAIFGVRPGAFHLTNLWLHITNALLVFCFLKRATGQAGKSLIIASLFAWHPINVETVAWVAERKGLLAMLFALLTLIAYVRYAERPSAARMVLVVFTMLLSLLCKSMAVILPALLLILDYWPLKRFPVGESGDKGVAGLRVWRRAVRLVAEKIPLFVLSAVFTLLTLRAESNVGAVRSLAQFSIGDRAVNCLSAIPLYLKQLLIPHGYAVYYPSARWSAGEMLLLIIAVVLLAWCAIRCLRTRKHISAGILWFLVGLAPILGIVKIGTHLMADRYTYLPQIGIFVALVWTISEWKWLTAQRQLLLFGVVAVLLIVSTHRQICCWKNDLALARNGERVTGKNALVCFGMGIGYDTIGDREKSLKSFREVLEHYFDYPGTHYNIARAYVLTGRPQRALAHLDIALRESPYDPRYHNLLAEVLSASADPAIRNGRKAMEHASFACRMSPNGNSLYLDTLAAAYAEAGEFPQARATATQAMQLAVSTDVQESIRKRIQLYSTEKAFRGILLHDAVVRRGK